MVNVNKSIWSKIILVSILLLFFTPFGNTIKAQEQPKNTTFDLSKMTLVGDTTKGDKVYFDPKSITIDPTNEEIHYFTLIDKKEPIIWYDNIVQYVGYNITFTTKGKYLLYKTLDFTMYDTEGKLVEYDGKPDKWKNIKEGDMLYSVTCAVLKEIQKNKEAQDKNLI